MLKVTVTAVENLAIAPGNTAGNVVGSLPFVPGSVFRGALAARWIFVNGPPSQAKPNAIEEFLRLFEGEARFSPLFAHGSAIEPIYVSRCKYQPQTSCQDVVVDQTATAASPIPDTCPECSGPLDPGKGRVLGLAMGERTSVELGDDETAVAGQLFSRGYIPAGTRFSGWIDANRNTHPFLSKPPTQLWFGGRRSVGGRAELEIEDDTLPQPEQRDQPQEVLVRLLSPAILVDTAGWPTLDAPTAKIAEGLGLPSDALRLVRSWVREQRIGGWHAASGLPKPMDMAVGPGSAFLFRASEPVEFAKLAQLASKGLGLRRSEGFGWIEVNPRPWDPPAPPVTAIAAPSAFLNEATSIAAALQPSSARWLGDRLRQFQMRVNRGATNAEASQTVTNMREFKEMPASIRQRVEALLMTSDAKAIADATLMLGSRR